MSSNFVSSIYVSASTRFLTVNNSLIPQFLLDCILRYGKNIIWETQLIQSIMINLTLFN